MNPAWQRAAEDGDVAGARDQLVAGGDVNALDRHGQTALMLAAHRGHLGLVELLIEAGADLNVTAKYRLSALMLAAIAGHAEVARRLIRAGADLAITGTGAAGFDGKTARDFARARNLDV